MGEHAADAREGRAGRHRDDPGVRPVGLHLPQRQDRHPGRERRDAEPDRTTPVRAQGRPLFRRAPHARDRSQRRPGQRPALAHVAGPCVASGGGCRLDRAATACTPPGTRSAPSNLYSAEPDAFDADDINNGHALAAHVGVALAASQNAEHLHEAIASRTVIGRAEGILMERFDLPADQAFGVLRRVSRGRNVKLEPHSRGAGPHRSDAELTDPPRGGRRAAGTRRLRAVASLHSPSSARSSSAESMSRSQPGRRPRDSGMVGIAVAELRLEPPEQRPLPDRGLRIAFADPAQERVGDGGQGCARHPRPTDQHRERLVRVDPVEQHQRALGLLDERGSGVDLARGLERSVRASGPVGSSLALQHVKQTVRGAARVRGEGAWSRVGMRGPLRESRHGREESAAG